MKTLSYDVIKEAYLKKGYEFPEGELKITGIRMEADEPDQFNDFLICCWEENGVGKFFGGYGTTDPGLYYRNNPLNIQGTATVVPGFYKHVWKLGLHNGYQALVQAGNFMVYRDNDKDHKAPIIKNGIAYDSKGNKLAPKIAGPNSGLNNHRAIKGTKTTKIGRFSAGCQVWASDSLFTDQINLVKNQFKDQKLFSYGLFVEADFK